MTGLIAVSDGGSYIELPCPSYGKYSTVPNEVVRAGTNTNGVLYKDRIRIRQSISVGWDVVPPEDKNLILRLTSGNSFSVRYFDTQDSTFKYGKFYRGNDLEITPVLTWKDDEFVCYNIMMSLVEF